MSLCEMSSFRRRIETNSKKSNFVTGIALVTCGLDTLLTSFGATRPPNIEETRTSMAWMYILKCADDSYYVGSTKNLDVRFAQHQSGNGSRYTSGRLPVELVYSEEYERVSDAYYREKQVQNWGRAKREALINGNVELLPPLAKKKFEKKQSNKRTPLVE